MTDASTARLRARASMRHFLEQNGFMLTGVFQAAPPPNMPAPNVAETPTEVRQYLWPAERNGSKVDRILWCFMYADGSWMTALADGQKEVATTLPALMAMAEASPPSVQ